MAQLVIPPDTPAGQVLAAYLAAFDSMDQAKVASYVKQYDPKVTAENMMQFARQTGGFQLIGIDGSEPLVVRFRVRDTGGTIGAGSLRLSAAEPHVVEQMDIARIPPGATVEWLPIDAAERARVIAGAEQQLNQFYLDTDVAKKMDAAVDEKNRTGAYNALTDGSAFADQLTKDLQAVSHDKHLGVRYSPAKDELKPGAAPAGPSDADMAEMRAQMERENCGFDKVEVLPRNIGYLKVNYFGDPMVCGAVAAHAMEYLAHVDAMIFDLRENHGGDPHMVEVLASYVFDRPTHLNDLVDRAANETVQYWTLPYLPGERLAKQPVYVLTSHNTFSGGEEFTYDLQTQKRGVIVGETTGGGAHPVSGHRIDDHFEIGVPSAHPVNPITKKDWEGTGVLPDVAVPAADALTTAEKLAGEKLATKQAAK